MGSNSQNDQFYKSDLDLDPMTLVLKLDLDMVKMYHCTNTHTHTQTHTHIHTHTHTQYENITFPHTRGGGNNQENIMLDRRIDIISFAG